MAEGTKDWTLEEVEDAIAHVIDLPLPSCITVSFTVHRLDVEVVREYARRHPEQVADKLVNFDGSYVLSLLTPRGQLALFSAPTREQSW